MQKIVPVAGDLIIEGLGMSTADREMLANDLDIIINCAASVNFDDPLLDAIQINYCGCLRMLDLAMDCKKLLAHLHVSTAYVNSNRKESANILIEEKIYPLEGGQDPEEVVNDLLH